MKEPIVEFKTQEELEASLLEWQERLFLQDWIIRGKIVDAGSLYNESRDRLSGENTFNVVNKNACICIEKLGVEAQLSTAKVCQEQVLVHELLHLKYNWIEIDTSKYEEAYFDTLEHGLIDQMAKSLIMAKYGIKLDWFKNF